MNNNSRKARKLRRVKNRERLNRLRGQQKQVSNVLFILPVFILMAVVKMGLPYNNPGKIVTFLRLLIDKLTGNPNFPTTDPTVAALTSKANELDVTIIDIIAGNKALIPHRNTLVAEAMEMIRLLSYDIQFQSGGDEEKIKSSGFTTRTFGGVSHTPGQVLVLVAKPVGPGKVKLRWKRLEDGRIYVIQYFTGGNIPPGPGGEWRTAGKTRNVSFTVEDLNPGELYYFRVYASNGNEDGNPSDPAEQRSL